MTQLNEVKTYYFQFSQGSCSDYSVDGVYICDHAIEEAEWDAYYKAYQEASQKERQSSKREWALREHPEEINDLDSTHWCIDWTPWYASKEYAVFNKWEQDNNPEKTFQESME